MIDIPTCDDKDLLVAYLYDDIDPVARRRVDEHLRVCRACATELAALAGVRQGLAEWELPEVAPGFTFIPKDDVPVAEALLADRPSVLRPSRWWPSTVPAWAQAAAAVLVLAGGLSLLNLQIRYGADGLVITTGWMSPSTPATGAVAAEQPAAAIVESGSDWRPALVALEQQLRGEIKASRGRESLPMTVSAVRPAGDVTLRRIAELIEESEQRQRRELALRLTQFGRDIEVQRRTDNRRNVQALGQFEVLSSAEMARQRQALDYIMRVSAQPPPR